MITNIAGVPNLLLILFGVLLQGITTFFYKYQVYESFNVVDSGHGTDILTKKSYRELDHK